MGCKCYENGVFFWQYCENGVFFFGQFVKMELNSCDIRKIWRKCNNRRGEKVFGIELNEKMKMMTIENLISI
jgi:hypothetical protein